MDYTTHAGQPTTGVVWSPGPMPGTVWVLPRTGATSAEAVVVHVAKRARPCDDQPAQLDQNARPGGHPCAAPDGHTLALALAGPS